MNLMLAFVAGFACGLLAMGVFCWWIKDQVPPPNW